MFGLNFRPSHDMGYPNFETCFSDVQPHFYAFDILWDEHAWSDDEEERRRFRNGEELKKARPRGDRAFSTVLLRQHVGITARKLSLTCRRELVGRGDMDTCAVTGTASPYPHTAQSKSFPD